VAASRRAPRLTRCTGRAELNSRIIVEEEAKAEPLLQAQIDINAPVPTVWALISDFNRMPQLSPQCRLMRALGPLRQGNFLFWPTTSTVTEVIPEKKLSCRVKHQRHHLEL
jgi:Polyketide cyclase / dehydrase and lipid transport